MEMQRTAYRRGIARLGGWMLVGVLPLSGCASPGEEGLFARGRKYSPPSVVASPPQSAVVRRAESSPVPYVAAQTAPPQPTFVPPPPPVPEIPGKVDDFAPPPPHSYPPARLVSEERTTAKAPPPAPRAPEQVASLPRSAPRVSVRPRQQGVVHANTADFNDQVLHSDVPVLVDFYASWCGPCKAMAPVLDEVAAENPQAKVVKVNIEDNPELAARYGVQAIPNLMVFKDGRVTASQKGLVSKARLKTMLE